MFESALLTELKSDSALCRNVSTYSGEPSIFSDGAPEAVTVPYITFTIMRYEGGSKPVDRFNIYIDFWDRSKSAKKARDASERIEFILDETVLSHARYDSIRLFRVAGGLIADPDPREIHYNMQFLARAGRKAWCEQL